MQIEEGLVLGIWHDERILEVKAGDKFSLDLETSPQTWPLQIQYF